MLEYLLQQVLTSQVIEFAEHIVKQQDRLIARTRMHICQFCKLG